MAQSSSDDSEEGIVGINVTPLVDVMLVLLIIFMVTANYIAQQSIQIQLPKADTGETPKTKNLSFVIDKESQLYYNGQPLDINDISKKIAAEKTSTEKVDLQAVLSADQATPHGIVVRVMDEIRKSGITDLAIDVDSKN